ncbi:transporter substrate-binding domain-containing protein [Kiloniella laminariae]|uniref:Transporter substrate-binding domain-containing protein n=1 Tax=Kiloniella laminariae TaxID=454162 RepID=A0ABT4LFT9_9PROT|nr:transporter substrate-binding domain-containing protein [Kiloniella laminariae]MCZ4279965.1 transporter substrate-binding domain-containing protein [Kiloniella laminariae]
MPGMTLPCKYSRTPRVLLLLSFLTLFPLWRTEATELKLVTGNYPPYTTEQRKGGGLVTEVVRHVFSHMGYETSVDFLPWKRGYVLAERGDFVATFPYLRTKEREAAFFFSDPVIEWRSKVFVHRKANIDFENLSDLAGLTECLPHHYGGLEQLDRMYAANEIRRIRPPFIKSCWLMVLKGRADFFIEDIFVAGMARREYLGKDREQVVDIGSFVSVDLGYVIFPRGLPGSEMRVQSFNQSLQELTDQGEIEQIGNGSLMRTDGVQELVN